MTASLFAVWPALGQEVRSRDDQAAPPVPSLEPELPARPEPIVEPPRPAVDATPASEGLRIRRVEILGLQATAESFVLRTIKTREGQPFVRADVEQDVRELLRTRKFLNAFADTRVEAGEAIVVFTLQEKPTVRTVELEGNKKFSDADLFELTPVAGAPLDRYEINRGRDQIVEKYKEAGYFYVEVGIDEAALEAESRVVYRITEGPRVRVRKILFEGNRAYSNLRLGQYVQSQTYIWIFRTGALDEETANRDAVAIQKFYRDEGYLDARAGYRLDFDPVKREDLNLVFVIEEGVRYKVQDITFEGNSVFDEARLRDGLKLAPDQFLRNEVLQQDLQRIQDMYGEIGYIDARIDTRPDFVAEPGLVILRFFVQENQQYRFGRITIRGNEQTKDEVIRRELLFYPGEYYNTVEVRNAVQRLRETGLFKPDSIEITPLEDLENMREALVKVEETETVQFLIGGGLSTDSGVQGRLSLENRNFDLFDWPRTLDEFFRGQAFRGDGQRLLIEFEPGTEVTRFRVAFTEPYLFDLPLRFDTSAYLFQRGREGYDEQRIGFSAGLSRRFRGGILDGWALEGSFRIEGIDISDVDAFAARPIREAKGGGTLTGLKGAIVRDTTDSRVFPTRGYRVAFSYEQVGALGGDYSFGKPAVSAAYYHTVSTDVMGRKSVVAVRADAAYIVGDAPVFERYYAGGFGSLRGFSFRTVSPRRGIKNQAVGGDFLFLTGAEYSFPLYGKEFRGVAFVDMGTVEEGFGLSSWRASAGFGLRVQVDFFGPVPLVFDFGFPLLSQDRDNTEIFNFAVGASF